MEKVITGLTVGGLEEAVQAVERLRTVHRQRCRQVFEARLTVARMAQDYLTIYQQLVADEGAR